MNKNVKKVILGMLTISMVAVLFTGCGSSSAKKDDGNYPTIKIAYGYSTKATDEKAIEAKLNKIMREKAHAQVDLVGIEFGNWANKLNLMLTGSGDNSVDLFNSFWYTPVSTLAANGQVMKLDDLIKKDGAGIKDLFKGEMKDYLKCGSVNGIQYGIPSYYSYVTENDYSAKKEDVAKANIDWSQVNSIDSMSDAILKLKKANPSKYFIPGSTEPYWVPKSVDYLGDTKYLGVLTNPTKSTKVENYYESDYFLNFLKHVKEWKKAGAISPDPLSNNNPTLNNLITGVADGTPGYAWDAKTSIEGNSAMYKVNLDGTNVTDALSTTSDVTTFMWHISSFCKNPDAAMRVLNVLYTDKDASQLIANGIEGLDYSLDNNGQMVYPKGKKSMTDLGWPAASLAYWPNVTLCKTWSYEPKDIYSKMLEKNKTSKKSLALGFTFDSTKVKDQIASCTNVVAQYYTPLMYGAVDIESTLPKFQDALKKAGINEIIAEKQKQLDAWLAKNKK